MTDMTHEEIKQIADAIDAHVVSLDDAEIAKRMTVYMGHCHDEIIQTGEIDPITGEFIVTIYVPVGEQAFEQPVDYLGITRDLS